MLFLVVREDPSTDDEYSLHETRERAIAAAKEYEAECERDGCVFTEEDIPGWEYSSQSDPASGDGPMVHVEEIHVEAP